MTTKPKILHADVSNLHHSQRKTLYSFCFVVSTFKIQTLSLLLLTFTLKNPIFACTVYVVWQKSNETNFLLTMNFILFTNQGYLFYPELDGKRSCRPVLTERLVTEGCWLRLVWTLKNWYSRIQLNSWCNE